MVKTPYVPLKIQLEEGTQLKVDLARQKIATCSQLRKYLRSVCAHRVLDLKGHPLKLWDAGYDLRTAFGSDRAFKAASLGNKAVRVFAVRAWDAPGAPWDLYIEAFGEPGSVQPRHLKADDSVLPYASFPSLPLEYQIYNPHDELRYGQVAKLIIKTMTGKSLELTTHLSASVMHAKSLIEYLDGLDPDEQRLIYKGRQLEDGTRLCDYNLESGDVIHLVLRLRGGMLHYTSGRNGFSRVAGLGHSDDCRCEQTRKRQRVSDANSDLVSSTQMVMNTDLQPSTIPSDMDPDITLPVDVFLPSGFAVSLRCPPQTMPCKIFKVITAVDAI